jgi:hypothetical protein
MGTPDYITFLEHVSYVADESECTAASILSNEYMIQHPVSVDFEYRYKISTKPTLAHSTRGWFHL